MRRKKSTAILSFLLAVMLAFGSLPVSAAESPAASGTGEVTTLISDVMTVDGTESEGETDRDVIYHPETIELSATEYTYDGKVHKPSVIVTDSNGDEIASSNYEVEYPKGCRNAGTYKITITFKGNYSGSATRSFTIGKVAQKISVSDLTKTCSSGTFSCGARLTQGDGKLSYKSSNTKAAVISSSGKITVKGSGKTKITVTAEETTNYSKASKSFYLTVNPAKVKISSVTSPKNGTIKVAWSKSAGVTGYQIRYSRYSDMSSAKTVTVKGSGTVSRTISGLSKGKKYYVQVRAYKTSGDSTYRGAWSSKKSVTVLNVRLNKTSVTLDKGKTVQLSVSGTKNKVSWSSSKTSVATVTQSGKVTAKSPGTAAIKAKVGGNTYTCKITVKAVSGSGGTVLITRTGECYHTHKCGNGTYFEVTLKEAKARGLRPCKKCY